MAIIVAVSYLARVFTLSVTFSLVYYLQARLEPTIVEPFTGLRYNGSLLALPTNIILG
jgi:hypothetical protein